MPTLTDKQRLFCELYVKTGNSARSYREAGYTSNVRNSGQCAIRLRKLPHVKEELERLRASGTIKPDDKEKIKRDAALAEIEVYIKRASDEGKLHLIPKLLDLKFTINGAFPEEKLKVSHNGFVLQVPPIYIEPQQNIIEVKKIEAPIPDNLTETLQNVLNTTEGSNE